MDKDNHLLPQPTIRKLHFLSLKEARGHIPIYSLPTSIQWWWRLDDTYGLTTPTMMSTTNEERFPLFRLCHPVSLIGGTKEVVCGPASGTPTNEKPHAILNFCPCRCGGVFAESPVHRAIKDDCITVPGHKWGSLFSDNVTAPGREGDSLGQSACYSHLGLPLPDEQRMELPALGALLKERVGVAKVKEFEEVVVVRVGGMCATNHK